MESIGNNISMALPGAIASASSSDTGAEKSIEQIEELGKEFESVFVSMLLKEMRNSLEDGFFGGEGSDSFGGMFDLFIGKHLAQSKPIGVGDLLVQQYSKGRLDDGEAPPAGVSFSA